MLPENVCQAQIYTLKILNQIALCNFDPPRAILLDHTDKNEVLSYPLSNDDFYCMPESVEFQIAYDNCLQIYSDFMKDPQSDIKAEHLGRNEMAQAFNKAYFPLWKVVGASKADITVRHRKQLQDIDAKVQTALRELADNAESLGFKGLADSYTKSYLRPSPKKR